VACCVYLFVCMRSNKYSCTIFIMFIVSYLFSCLCVGTWQTETYTHIYIISVRIYVYEYGYLLLCILHNTQFTIPIELTLKKKPNSTDISFTRHVAHTLLKHSKSIQLHCMYRTLHSVHYVSLSCTRFVDYYCRLLF
jgi:hypothetical protein